MNETRRAIIVGGAGGIGSAVCRKLASEGYRIVVADYNLERAREVAAALKGSGHDAIQIDVMNEVAIVAAFDAIEASSPASVLVVATGGPVVSLEKRVNILTMDSGDWDKTLAFNLTAVLLCIQKFARQRQAIPMEGSRVIVIGSGAGQMASSGTDIAYGASKAGVIGLVRQAACDLAPLGITVNNVAPGPVGTDEFYRNTNEQIRSHIASMTLLNRIAVPDEIGAAVAYLASREASYITGTTLDINGGAHMH